MKGFKLTGIGIICCFAIPIQVTAQATDELDYHRHIVELKRTLPDGFHVVIEKPFVVIGDDQPDVVEKWACSTVRWTVDRIKKQYFKRDPKQIVDIWLLKNKASYRKHCRSIVGYAPHTPYGFYSSTHHAILMNISTGGGTLVHEIVHPFIENNFPDCPAWFNEGLASLYEQCRDENGQIWGSTNWRLRGLQLAIKSDTLPSFEHLCNTSQREFYDGEKGDNYAQARYLCYYLQEKGLLNRYYHAFRKNSPRDPGGYATLLEVLQEKNMTQFENRWKKYCLELRFPN